ncbi:unnamed protein product, partial [Urochloa humidicola]
AERNKLQNCQGRRGGGGGGEIGRAVSARGSEREEFERETPEMGGAPRRPAMIAAAPSSLLLFAVLFVGRAAAYDDGAARDMK